VSELGKILREARTSAGLSLSGMANRTGYSRSYIGNIENGVRAATPDVIKAYERALGDSMQRRSLLFGTLGILAAGAPDDTATAISHEITNGRSGLLTELQTSHATDKAIAGIVSQDTASLASLAKWSRTGKAVLRVNATGIMAKARSPVVEAEAVTVLRTDGDVRELYLTAVLSRTLTLPWDGAAALTTGGNLTDAHVDRLVEELANPYDAGARWCATLALHRGRSAAPERVAGALVGALRTETSGENLRAIGGALAGIDPTKL
jgi:hypothetical protein